MHRLYMYHHISLFVGYASTVGCLEGSTEWTRKVLIFALQTNMGFTTCHSGA